MTAIELAAIASAAVPGLNVTAFGPEPDDAADFSSALLVDSENRRWRVRSPKHVEASARLETERQVLRAFSPAIRAELPFLLPTVAGTVRQGELITFVYSHIVGKAESVEELSSGGAALALEIGAAIAAIHDLPQELVTNADLPSYTANEFRQRKLNELDQAATTGKIPPSLLLRWEHAMEDVALWRFNSSVVHGDLHEDNILLDGTKVTAVMGWTDLRVGDPADDFAWLVAINDPAFVDTVMQAYAAARHETPDPHLLRRAALSAEFALAQWLVKGFAADSARMVADAETMLRTLKADIDLHGGQPISTEPAPVAEPAKTETETTESASESVVGTSVDPDATGAIQVVMASPAVSAVEPVEAKPAVELPGSEAKGADSAPADDDAAADVAEAGTAGEATTGPDAGTDDTAADNAAGGGEDVDTTAMKVIPLKATPNT
ncbi:aminoglycoside phosphotransferase [Arthrobacter sp. ERGS1:01]|uniref:macrolide 2'-phosphotransferase n=1 Tax=Arthrobacter sp. ERGS1:01 TaxID=1704044 RepID=UPI0006B53592|nr:macrolide 2'-phosphotransferase [Arthrobacter sp. ERGS1:01]ALE06723.1 aminoglycoside phosphotransferase [Arthrobacter sp. ERGS1:01]